MCGYQLSKKALSEGVFIENIPPGRICETEGGVQIVHCCTEHQAADATMSLKSHQITSFMFKVMKFSPKRQKFSLNPHFELKKLSLDDFFNDDLSASDREP